jgi:L-ascorbate metabolism protein UlaG (beta-lactamase superfamily)
LLPSTNWARLLAVQTGARLIADIDATRVSSGNAAFWWLGQHSFVVKTARRVLYFDPFLSPEPDRLIPPLLAPAEVTHADLIFGSHDHLDHIDRAILPGLAQASPKCRIVVPELIRATLARDLAIAPERFAGLDDGLTVEIDGVRVSAIAAAHEFLDQDPATGRFPYLGYIVECDGVTIYHAGDTCLYEGLITKLRRWQIDVAFLPINGRDARRLAAGWIGNMTYQEAADLAGAIRPRLTVPAHYDMFAFNPGDVGAFSDYMRVKYPHLAVRVCGHGVRQSL